MGINIFRTKNLKLDAKKGLILAYY